MRRWSLFVVFFFSSRRRHTRSLRDWSSDVCSSDLGATMTGIAQDRYGPAPEAVLRVARIAVPAAGDGEVLVRVHASSVDRGTWHLMRSEERRVGKECRCRWSRADAVKHGSRIEWTR